MDRDKILIVIPDLQLGGGAQRIAAEVGSNLNKRDYEVTFFTVYDEETIYGYDGEYITLDRPRISLPLGFSFNILRAARRIAKVCKERDIDTVISFMMMGNLSTVLSRVVFRNKAKIILSVRNNPLKSDKKSRWQKKMLYGKADKVVALSEGVEHILKKDFSLSNTTYIHNIQDIEKFNKLAEKEVKEEHKEIFNDGFVFITIGSLRRAKGQWYLLRCFKKVVEANKEYDPKLIILGDGNLKPKLIRLTKDMNLENNVLLLGKVENVFPYLKKSDCFVFSSIHEGFGNVLTEALSQNLPVISTDCIAGPREILCPELEINEEIEYPYYGRYGILTESFEDRMFFKTLEEESLSKQEEMFAKIMNELMQDGTLGGKYSNGLERVEEFEVDKILIQWKKLV